MDKDTSQVVKDVVKTLKINPDTLFKKADKKDIKAIKKLEKMFKKEALLLDDKIASFYSKYGKNNVIEYRELFVKLGEAERQQLLFNTDAFIEKYPKYREIVQVKDKIYQLDRYESLQHDLLLQQLRINDVEESYIREHLKMLSQDASRFILEEKGTGSNFNVYNPNVVDEMINYKWKDNFSLTDRLIGDKRKIRTHLENDFKIGVARGETYQILSKKLQERLVKTSLRTAKVLIRTEGTRIMNEAMIKEIEREGGYTHYIYRAVMDERTTEICRSLDGQIFKIEERQAGVNFPPLHPQCRSSFETVIPENAISDIVKIYKDYKNANNNK